MLRKSTFIYLAILVVVGLIGICLSINPDTARWLSTLLSGLFVGSIALFHQRIWNYFTKPKLDIELNLKSPDCHRTEIGSPQQRFPCYYFRLRIYNRGESLSKDVEVIIQELWIDRNGRFERDGTFLPLNLVWSHMRSLTGSQPAILENIPVVIFNQADQTLQIRQNIPPFNAFRFCDLLFIRHEKDPNQEGRNGSLQFRFDFFIESFARSNKQDPGNYKIKLTVLASNSEPKDQWFQIRWTGKWAEKEEKMFTQDNIIIKPTTPEK